MKYRKLVNLLLLFATSTTAMAEKLPVKTLRVSGPYTMTAAPIRTDSIDANCKRFEEASIQESSISTKAWINGTLTDANAEGQWIVSSGLSVVGFTFENTHYAKVSIKVEGKQKHTVYIDNNQGAEQSLLPGRHDVAIKVLCKAGEADTLKVELESEQSQWISVNPTGKRTYTLADYMNGEKLTTATISASGRYILLSTSTTRTDGKTDSRRELLDLKTGNATLADGFTQWASQGDRYIRSHKGTDNETIYEIVDLATQQATPLFINTLGTKDHVTFLDGEKEMVVYQSVEGPKEDAQVHQVLEPDDRQPGWRNRNNLQLIDVASGQLTQLTQGPRNVYPTFSPDNRKVLLSVHYDAITERPFNFTDILLYDRNTQQLDTLVLHDGFVGSAEFTPDGQSIIFMGSPEAFGGIGINDPTGKTPSMTQEELFIMDLSKKVAPTGKQTARYEVRSLTFDFNPNVKSFNVSKADGAIYALCENRDRQDIYRYDFKKAKWTQLQLTECYIKAFSLANDKPMMCYRGQSDSNADRLYTVDLKTGKETLVRDWNEKRMGDIQLGKCEDWNFVSSRGDTIYGRYYLPPHFDASKKYPMLVYYYGGCSPTGRYLESYYNFHGWAAMDYVVYVVQPSGCTGFGQEFAARHSNTYGQGTADDIIEGTKKFCAEHAFVNASKVGCLGASYGGFMTQYLMTVTDIFAASMSHAGISNPTSYWGYGYWGYSYSAVSAPNSYPWNNEKLFSGQAPLFNADKVHTPILFLHGGSDTNVPINESIQMFTALKILGRECAFVTVEGQDHHILDYEKQRKWVSTYYAWFAKWLQDDPTWWNALYPAKNL